MLSEAPEQTAAPVSVGGGEDKSPSLIGGAMIIAGTAIGAGMFSLPVVASGMWFNWSVICLILTFFFMYHSGLMILETNLNYPVGSSFDTITKDTLGPVWNLINGLSIVFVLYVLTYAYISAGSSIINQTLESTLGIVAPPKISGLIFSFSLAFVVWLSTKTVDRITTILLGAMVVTFFMYAGNITSNLKSALLFDREGAGVQYFPFIFAALPFFVASFGFHANVPSLMKYYGKEPIKIRKCLLYGSLLPLVIYLLWQASVFGSISRQAFIEIIDQGGNVGVLVNAMGSAAEGQFTHTLLNVFSNFAVTSSFLGVSLGLFDYIADKYKFSDSGLGRLKTAAVTFIPPTIGGVLYPGGFIYAIGFAGLAGAIWGIIVPALMVKSSRERSGSTMYRVWGGNGLVYAVLLFGIVTAACHLLGFFNLLPIYG
ncbi:tryptophan permease [Luminiphilus syltensis]|nr:tryptophan permease [Luminiphilus syltensis]